MTTVSHDDKNGQINPEIMDRIRQLIAKSRRIELVFDGIAVEVPPLLRAQISMAVQEEPDGDGQVLVSGVSVFSNHDCHCLVSILIRTGYQTQVKQ